MNNHKEIKQILATLANGFPSFAPGNPSGMIEAYALALGDIDPMALREAALSLMGRSKFFPAIAELRVEAMKHNHYRPQPDALRIEAITLVNKFAQGQFEPAEWERLAVQFEADGRTDAAAGLRNQCRARAAILTTTDEM